MLYFNLKTQSIKEVFQMNENRKKDFNKVTKIYDAADYHKQDEVSQGLATTHEQVSDVYMAGDILTHDPKYQNRDSKNQ